MSTSSPDKTPPPMRRRSLMKTAAWAAPTAAVSVAAPAFAVSPESKKGLQGWVTVQSSCRNGQTLTIDGRGSYPDRGLWIMETAEGFDLSESTVEGAKITFYFPSTLGNLSWTNRSGAGWSNLTRDDSAPQKAGYVAYSSTYGGQWRYDATHDVLIAVGQPRFEATRSGCSRITAYARRSVTVDGEFIAFERGPITLGN